jgi:hypothetical protein
MWGVVSLTPNSQAGGPHLVSCPLLLIHYIRSYPPYLEAVSSVRNLRTRHAVVTRDPTNMDILYLLIIPYVYSGCSFILSFLHSFIHPSMPLQSFVGPWTSGQPVARLLPTQRHSCLEWDSNPRSQRSSDRKQFMA